MTFKRCAYCKTLHSSKFDYICVKCHSHYYLYATYKIFNSDINGCKINSKYNMGSCKLAMFNSRGEFDKFILNDELYEF